MKIKEKCDRNGGEKSFGLEIFDSKVDNHADVSLLLVLIDQLSLTHSL